MKKAVPAAAPGQASKMVLGGLHIVLSATLILMSLITHGRVPGMSADSSAALGFLVFFGLGLPLALLALGVLTWSILSNDRSNNVLAAVLFVSIFCLVNVWSGLIASVSYLFLSIRFMLQRLQRRTQAEH